MFGYFTLYNLSLAVFSFSAIRIAYSRFGSTSISAFRYQKSIIHFNKFKIDVYESNESIRFSREKSRKRSQFIIYWANGKWYHIGSDRHGSARFIRSDRQNMMYSVAFSPFRMRKKKWKEEKKKSPIWMRTIFIWK